MKPIYLFIGIALLSCNRKQTEEQGQTHTINIEVDKAVAVNSENSSSRTIHFNESDSLFCGMVSKLDCVNDTIYILDMFKNKGLYAYSPDGSLLFAYTAVGNGPEEFLGIADFQIDSDHISLLDNHQQKIIILDKKGKFVGKTDAGKFATSFRKDPDGGMWYNHGNTVTPESDTKLTYARDGHTENVLAVPEKIANITITAVTPFSSASDGTVHYLADFEPRVYECKDGKAELLWELDFGGRWIPDNKIATGEHPLAIMQDIEADGYVYQLNILEDNERVYFPFTCEKIPYIAIHDKKSGETKTYSFDTDQQPVGIINGAIVIPGEDSLTLITIE